jgi:tetratricopeptide (TPR) repeat protein
MSSKHPQKKEYSFYDLFYPLTTKKAIIIISLVGFIVYFNMLFNGFVWDDNEYLLKDSVVHSINLFSIFGPNIFNDDGQYRALTVMYFSLFYTLFGQNIIVFHSIQLILHVANSCLLFILFKRFFNKGLSLFLVLIFLVHPMQVESVSYISSSDSPLFFLFGIFALLLGMSEKERYKRTFLKYLLLLASVLVKETGFLFFPLLFLYKYFYKRVNSVIDYVYAALLVVIYFIIRNGIGKVSIVDRQMIPIDRLSFNERLLTIPLIIFYYIKTFFYPVVLAVNQQWVIRSATYSQFYLPLIFDILFFSLLIFFCIFLYKKKQKEFPLYVFFLIWYFLGLGLHSQIIPLDMTVADRWAYFEIPGLLGLIGVIVQTFFKLQSASKKKILISTAILIILMLAIRTIARNSDWQNPEHLWTQAISVDDNYLSEDELALALLDNGKFKEAIIHAKKSVSFFPNDNNLYNLGYIYEEMGNTKEAQQTYYQAYYARNYIPWQHRHYYIIYARLGILLIYHENFEAAKKILTSGVKDYPENQFLWFYLAISEYKLGDQNDAMKSVNQALLLSPNEEAIENLYQRIGNHLSVNPVYTNPIDTN